VLGRIACSPRLTGMAGHRPCRQG